MKTIAIDFDGVVAEYKTFKEDNKAGAPVNLKTMVGELKRLQENDWKIIIWTCRKDQNFVETYLNDWCIPYDAINHNPWAPNNVKSCRKIHANVYVDDKTIPFDGDWNLFSEKVMSFRPWWKEKKSISEKEISEEEKAKLRLDASGVKPPRPHLPLEVCGHKVDQVALFTDDMDTTISEYKKLGFDKWIFDEVYTIQQTGLSLASRSNFCVQLAFNYDILPGGVEFEILELIEGDTVQLPRDWEQMKSGLSHYGFHVDDIDDAIAKFAHNGYRLMATIDTTWHSNAPNKYRYAYMDTRKLGFISKLIIKR